jgi:hypothetical protein
MEKIFLRKKGPNFFGFENIDSAGQIQHQPAVLRGSGELTLTEKGLFFKQWVSQKEYFIPLNSILRLEIKRSHNMKVQFPAKVLRVYFKEENKTRIFGIALGGKFSITKGWLDDSYKWKETIEKLMKDSNQISQNIF